MKADLDDLIVIFAAVGMFLYVIATSSCSSSVYSNPGPVGIQVYPECNVETLQLHHGFDSDGQPAEAWIVVDVPGERSRICLLRGGIETCFIVDAETLSDALLDVEELFEEDVPDG